MKLLVPFVFGVLILAGACSDGGDSDEPAPTTPVNTPLGTPSSSITYCDDEAINGAADTWVTSITLLVEEKPELDLSDEEGMRDDIEAATRKFCEAGQAPPPEAVDIYCDGIVASIDLRLDGPTTDRDAFLTEYYNTCNATD